MEIFIYIVVLVMGGMIFFNSGEHRLKLFLLAVVFLPYIIPFPSSGINSHRFFILVFWASSLLNKEIVTIKNHFIVPFIVLILISYYLTGFHDDRIPLFSRIWKPTIHFLSEYGLLFFGFVTPLSRYGHFRFRKFIFNLCFIVCGYGLLTFFMGIDPYSQGIAAIFNNSDVCDFIPYGEGRFRTCSFLLNSHKFGFFCTVMTILMTYFNLKKSMSQKEVLVFFITLSCLFVSGSRSSLLAALIGIIVLFLFGINIKRKIQYILISLLVMLLISQVSFVQRTINAVAIIFEDNVENNAGSTIEMRQKQLEISLALFSQEPLWGNGFDYYGEVLKKDDKIIKQKGLLGAESYVFNLLIERGAIQIVIISIFIIAFFFLWYKNMKFNRIDSAVGLAIFLSFLSVSMTTGNNNKWVFALPIIGLYLNNHKKNLN